jgi:hypothetical protein
MASALETLEPWIEQHLPDLEPFARRHFVHLVTGIIEQQSLLLRAIAAASPLQAEPESNYTQVQRIIRDTRLTLETMYSQTAQECAVRLGARARDRAATGRDLADGLGLCLLGTLAARTHPRAARAPQADHHADTSAPAECDQTGLGGAPGCT